MMLLLQNNAKRCNHAAAGGNPTENKANKVGVGVDGFSIKA